MLLDDLMIKLAGGPGSGNHDHSGIKGHRGGSAPKLNSSEEIKVMTVKDYIRSKGGPERFDIDVATNRLPGITDKQRKQLMKRVLARQVETLNQREQLRQEYNKLVEEGKIKPPGRIEYLIETARGHSDNASVQAARRLLDKKGIKY